MVANKEMVERGWKPNICDHALQSLLSPDPRKGLLQKKNQQHTKTLTWQKLHSPVTETTFAHDQNQLMSQKEHKQKVVSEILTNTKKLGCHVSCILIKNKN